MTQESEKEKLTSLSVKCHSLCCLDDLSTLALPPRPMGRTPKRIANGSTSFSPVVPGPPDSRPTWPALALLSSGCGTHGCAFSGSCDGSRPPRSSCGFLGRSVCLVTLLSCPWRWPPSKVSRCVLDPGETVVWALFLRAEGEG